MNRTDRVKISRQQTALVIRTSHYYCCVLRRHREYNGYTQETIAERSGLHISYLSMIENGAAKLSIDNIYRICNAQGIEPIWLHQQVEIFRQIDDIQTAGLTMAANQTYHPINLEMRTAEGRMPFYL